MARAPRGGSERLREAPLPCGSTKATAHAFPQSCSTTYQMRWKIPWGGRLVCGGVVLELEVGPGWAETPELSREKSGSGSWTGETGCEQDEVLFVYTNINHHLVLVFVLDRWIVDTYMSHHC